MICICFFYFIGCVCVCVCLGVGVRVCVCLGVGVCVFMQHQSVEFFLLCPHFWNSFIEIKSFLFLFRIFFLHFRQSKWYTMQLVVFWQKFEKPKR